MDTSTEPHMLMRATTLAYLAAFVFHNADHARRGVDATPEAVVWAGTLVAMLTAVVATLVFTRHQLASRVAAICGLAIAVGVSFAHLIPIESALTDPLTADGINAVSWIAVLAEIILALTLAFVGWRITKASTHWAGRHV